MSLRTIRMSTGASSCLVPAVRRPCLRSFGTTCSLTRSLTTSYSPALPYILFTRVFRCVCTLHACAHACVQLCTTGYVHFCSDLLKSAAPAVGHVDCLCAFLSIVLVTATHLCHRAASFAWLSVCLNASHLGLP